MSDLAYNKFDEKYFTTPIEKKYPPPKSRAEAKRYVEKLYDQVYADMRSDLARKAVLLCLDGGTCNKTTLINFTVEKM